MVGDLNEELVVLGLVWKYELGVQYQSLVGERVSIGVKGFFVKVQYLEMVLVSICSGVLWEFFDVLVSYIRKNR